MGGISIRDRFSGAGLKSGVSHEDILHRVEAVTDCLQAGILFAKINFIPTMKDYLQQWFQLSLQG